MSSVSEQPKFAMSFVLTLLLAVLGIQGAAFHQILEIKTDQREQKVRSEHTKETLERLEKAISNSASMDAVRFEIATYLLPLDDRIARIWEAIEQLKKDR